jgi:hypothetical protein
MRWTFTKYPIHYPEFIAAIDKDADRRGVLTEMRSFIPEQRFMVVRPSLPQVEVDDSIAHHHNA